MDPGEYGIPKDLQEADAILITHFHFDHISDKALEEVYEKNKSIKIYGTESLDLNMNVPVHVVKDGDKFNIKDIRIRVIGKYQDVTSIYDSPIENVGYYIDEKVFHPGDALTLAENINTVIVPMAAPWAKFSEVEKYLKTLKPKYVLPNHDIILNDLGINFSFKSLKNAAEKAEAKFIKMNVDDEIVL